MDNEKLSKIEYKKSSVIPSKPAGKPAKKTVSASKPPMNTVPASLPPKPSTAATMPIGKHDDKLGIKK